MTAAIPTQRVELLSKREQVRLDEIVAKAAVRLRFAQLSAPDDPEGAQEQVDNISLYVTRELARMLGPQRCAVLDQRAAFHVIGNAIIAGAKLVDGVR